MVIPLKMHATQRILNDLLMLMNIWSNVRPDSSNMLIKSGFLGSEYNEFSVSLGSLIKINPYEKNLLSIIYGYDVGCHHRSNNRFYQ